LTYLGQRDEPLTKISRLSSQKRFTTLDELITVVCEGLREEAEYFEVILDTGFGPEVITIFCNFFDRYIDLANIILDEPGIESEI
jgi:hypothetical protein